MINIVLALTLTLSAAALASVPVAAAEQEKDRCVLTEDPAEKIADCRKLPRKNASRFDELARKIRALCPNDESDRLGQPAVDFRFFMSVAHHNLSGQAQIENCYMAGLSVLRIRDLGFSFHESTDRA